MEEEFEFELKTFGYSFEAEAELVAQCCYYLPK